jgi:MFS family permease
VNQARSDHYPNPAYAWYVVVLLLLAYVVSFIDRQILALLIDPIKTDLGLTDTSISLLHGFAFAIFYTAMGIPIGRLADHRSRRGIIAVGVLFWSLMTAACGLARNFWQLLIARIGVGVGEASLLPSAYSLISDYFPPRKRSRPISVFALGPFVGAGMAYILGGAIIRIATAAPELVLPVLGTITPWRLTFMLVAIPGILVALLMLTVREPQRREMQAADSDGGKKKTLPLSEAVRFVRDRSSAYFMLFLGFALLSMLSFAFFAWIPSFFIRTHGWSMGQVGLGFGLVVLICGPLGTLFGGYLADRLQARGQAHDQIGGHQIKAGMISAVAMTVSSVAAMLMPTAASALAALALAMFFHGMPVSLAPSALQAVTPNQMRGQMVALFNLVVNVIGFGVGPTAVALVTDFVFADTAAVGWSLAIVAAIAGPLAFIVLRFAMKPYGVLVKNWKFDQV